MILVYLYHPVNTWLWPTSWSFTGELDRATLFHADRLRWRVLEAVQRGLSHIHRVRGRCTPFIRRITDI